MVDLSFGSVQGPCDNVLSELNHSLVNERSSAQLQGFDKLRSYMLCVINKGKAVDDSGKHMAFNPSKQD